MSIKFLPIEPQINSSDKKSLFWVNKNSLLKPASKQL
jgi:hypothetical protein